MDIQIHEIQDEGMLRLRGRAENYVCESKPYISFVDRKYALKEVFTMIQEAFEKDNKSHKVV